MFVSPTDARSYSLSGTTADDPASTNDEPNLNDNNTGTTASAEIRAGMTAYKIIHDLGFPVANLDNSNFSIRVFDGSIMSTTDMVEILPYIDGNSVDAGESITLAINDNGAYDTLLLPASFVDALADVGTNEIAIRLAIPNSSGRGRYNEIQIEFFEVAAGPGGIAQSTVDLAASIGGTPGHQQVTQSLVDMQAVIADSETARNAIASAIFGGLATGTGIKSISQVAQAIVDLVDTVAAAQAEAHSGVAALLLDVFGLTDTAPGKAAVAASVIDLMADSAGEGNRSAVALAVFDLLASTVGGTDPASPTGTATTVMDFLSLALQKAGRIGAAQSLVDLVADAAAAADRRGAAQSLVDQVADSIMIAARRGAANSQITSLEITQGSGAHSGVADERVGLRVTTEFFAGQAAVTIHCIPLAGVFDITHNLVGRM